MDKIKKFFECLIPETVCNLRCGYCYVIQRSQNTMKVPELDYPPEIIGKALTQERLGGVCYFSICGAGETFVPDYLIEIVYELLKKRALCKYHNKWHTYKENEKARNNSRRMAK